MTTHDHPRTRIGEVVRWVEDCESTQDLARELASEGAATGTVVATRLQSAGRGRRGSAWHQGGDLGLAFSIILRPGLVPDRYPLLTVALGAGAAVALRELLEVEIRMKWPNDLVNAEGRKLAGILVEAEHLGVPDALVIAGIGLNLSQRPADFPPELRSTAASLAMLTGARLPPREAVLEAVLAGCDHVHAHLEDGDDDALEEVWNRVSSDVGRRCRIGFAGAELVGTVRRFSASEGVVMDGDDGQVVKLRGEQISSFLAEGSLRDPS